jgi:hypothetical protein
MHENANTTRRRLHLYRIIVIVLLIILFLLTIGFGINGPSMNDTVLSIMFSHDTIYTNGYTERAWLNIRSGMQGSEVRALLGPPFKTLDYPGGLEAWLYTKSPSGSDYWKRVVLLRDGIVMGLDGGFYDD